MESEIGENESVSGAVRRAVSAVNGQKPGSLHPLTDVINPEALDALFDSRPSDGRPTDGRLSFSYSNCRITIDTGGRLTIEPFEATRRLSAQTDSTGRAERSHSKRDTHHEATERTPGSRLCVVCQEPIEQEELQREQGELAHLECRPELRCGISLNND